MDALISMVYTIIDSVCVCLFLDAFASHRWRNHRFLVGVIVQTILMYASIEFSVIALNRNQIVKILLILLSCFIVARTLYENISGKFLLFLIVVEYLLTYSLSFAVGMLATSEAFLQGATSRTSKNATPGNAISGNVKVTSANRHIENGTQIGNDVNNDPLEELYWTTGVELTPPLDKFVTNAVTNTFTVADIENQTYTGEELTPAVTVQDGDTIYFTDNSEEPKYYETTTFDDPDLVNRLEDAGCEFGRVAQQEMNPFSVRAIIFTFLSNYIEIGR